MLLTIIMKNGYHILDIIISVSIIYEIDLKIIYFSWIKIQMNCYIFLNCIPTLCY